MTIQPTFFNWQRSGLDWDAAPYETCSPNLLALLDYLEVRWGGKSLGCHVDRSIRSGSSTSSHAYGAALDWRWGDAVDRQTLVGEVLPWLIDNSAELGIDAIHDYVGDRIWRASRTTDTADAHTTWWKKQDGSGGNMGASWAVWLHVETHKDTWPDGTPIAQRLPEPPAPQPPASLRRSDLFDISVYQTITKWADVPVVPIVHRVVTKEGDIDARFASRMPVISKRTEIFGGYVVLAPGIVAEQMATYITAMRPFWRDGAFTQLDVEPWDGLGLISLDGLDRAIAVHDAEFGPDRVAVYMNPYVTPDLWAGFVQRHPTTARWVPGYRPEDDVKAAKFDATIHQWSSSERPTGFTGPVDANEVRDWGTLRFTAGLDRPLPVVIPDPDPVPDPVSDPVSDPVPLPIPAEESDMFTWSHKGYANAFLIGAGPALPLSPAAFKACNEAKLPHIDQDDHPTMLQGVLHQSGLHESDLTPRP